MAYNYPDYHHRQFNRQFSLPLPKPSPTSCWYPQRQDVQFGYSYPDPEYTLSLQIAQPHPPMCWDNPWQPPQQYQQPALTYQHPLQPSSVSYPHPEPDPPDGPPTYTAAQPDLEQNLSVAALVSQLERLTVDIEQLVSLMDTKERLLGDSQGQSPGYVQPSPYDQQPPTAVLPPQSLPAAAPSSMEKVTSAPDPDRFCLQSLECASKLDNYFPKLNSTETLGSFENTFEEHVTDLEKDANSNDGDEASFNSFCDSALDADTRLTPPRINTSPPPLRASSSWFDMPQQHVQNSVPTFTASTISPTVTPQDGSYREHPVVVRQPLLLHPTSPCCSADMPPVAVAVPVILKEARYLSDEKVGVIVASPHKEVREAKSVGNLSELFANFANDVIYRVALGRKYDDEEFKKASEELGVLLGSFDVGEFVPWVYWIKFVNGMSGRVRGVARNIDGNRCYGVTHSQSPILDDKPNIIFLGGNDHEWTGQKEEMSTSSSVHDQTIFSCDNSRELRCSSRHEMMDEKHFENPRIMTSMDSGFGTEVDHSLDRDVVGSNAAGVSNQPIALLCDNHGVEKDRDASSEGHQVPSFEELYPPCSSEEPNILTMTPLPAAYDQPPPADCPPPRTMDSRLDSLPIAGAIPPPPAMISLLCSPVMREKNWRGRDIARVQSRGWISYSFITFSIVST